MVREVLERSRLIVSQTWANTKVPHAVIHTAFSDTSLFASPLILSPTPKVGVLLLFPELT